LIALPGNQVKPDSRSADQRFPQGYSAGGGELDQLGSGSWPPDRFYYFTPRPAVGAAGTIHGLFGADGLI